ncbi:MAG: Arm DNA-binding domain-containing protein, partial [Woeseiaceae bacterium]
MALTALKIRQAKPKEKPYKLFDERGLFLLVNPTGSKLWRFRYKYAGKEKQISFGHYPDISLADAQASRGQALTLEPDSLYGAGHRVHP